MKAPVATLLALAAASLAAASAMAENRMSIDDFSTGHYQSPAIKKGSQTSTQSGGMVGGARGTTMTLCATGCAVANPYGQTASYAYVANKAQPGTNAFVQSVGFGLAPRIDQGYGPMNEDFARFDRVRVNFVGLSDTLNFNILMFSGAGRGQNGCNLGQRNGVFSVEFPFSGFVPANGGFVPGDITDISLVYQSSSVIGSIDFAISSIEVSDTPMPGAIVCKLLAG